MDDDEFFHSKNLRGVDNDSFLFSDILLTGDLSVEGTTNLEGTLDMGSAQIKNVAAGNLNQDAVNLSQFTTANSGLFLKLNGTSTMGGTLNTGGAGIFNVKKLKGLDNVDRFEFDTTGKSIITKDLSFSGQFIKNGRNAEVIAETSNGTKLTNCRFLKKFFLRFDPADTDGIREHILDDPVEIPPVPGETKKLLITGASGKDINFNLKAPSTKSSNLGLYVGGTAASDTGFRIRGNTTNLRFQTREDGSSDNANAITVTFQSRVGIGLITPAAQLDVEGQILSTYNPLPIVTCRWINSTSTAVGRNIGIVTKVSDGRFLVNFTVTFPNDKYVAIPTLRRQNPNYRINIDYQFPALLGIVITNLSGTVKNNDWSLTVFATQ